MIDLDLRQVRYAVAIGDELDFGRAAARLIFIGQTLSAQIRQHEETAVRSRWRKPGIADEAFGGLVADRAGLDRCDMRWWAPDGG